MLIGLGFLIILAGVLVAIFAMKPKTTRYRRPMRTFIIGQTPPPFRTNSKDDDKEEEETDDSLNLAIILGPILAILGVIVCMAGAILYAVNYRRKKQKDKEASRQSAVDEEAGARESSPIESSPSAVNLACPDVATSQSDIQLNATQTSEEL